MIINLLNSGHRFWWILFHFVFGIAAVSSNIYVIVWFYFSLTSTIYLVSFPNVNKPLLIAATMVYIGAFELLARMTNCSPFIPWEASKYIFTLLSVSGILLSVNKSKQKVTGGLILLLLVPSLLIDKSGQVTFNDIVFNILGVVNIGFGMIFFGALKVTRKRFFDLLRLIIFPCISILTYTIIKTPDLKEISFTLSAHTATSGEFGSNQVSTVLGLAFFLMSVAWLMNLKITNYRLTDGVLAVAFLVQGLFTFSRGGMIGGGVGLLCFLFILMYNRDQKLFVPLSLKKYILPVVIIFMIAIVYANEITGGGLLLRYKGETEGTLIGSRERNLSTITSGRDVIFFSDLELWSMYPVLGAGAGASKYLRTEGQVSAAHVELSRLLAEHGLTGLIIFILLLLPAREYLKGRDPGIKAIRIALFCIAIFTTFHSATRTFVTPLLLSLCAVNIRSNQESYDSVPGK